MAIRALIIAIEEYPNAKGLAPTLPGTLQAGLDFRGWLMSKLKAEGKQDDAQIIFCSSPAQRDGREATQAALVDAIIELRQAGIRATDELFVFFSGHGFSFADQPAKQAHIILTSGFVDAQRSALHCLNLDEIINVLRYLGPGRHYYFVDACRNLLDATQAAVGSAIPIIPDGAEGATTYLLQSTVAGAVATVNGAFSRKLLAGLHGEGKAKTWDPQYDDRMLVRYDTLRLYLKAQLAAVQPITSTVMGDCGESEGVLAQIQPVPTVDCTIAVEDFLAGGDDLSVVVTGRRGVSQTIKVVSSPLTLQLHPDSYTFSLASQAGRIVIGQDRVDVFDNQTVTLKTSTTLTLYRDGRGRESDDILISESDSAEVSQLEVIVPSNAFVLLENVDEGSVQAVKESQVLQLPSGEYVAKMHDSSRRLISKESLHVSRDTPPLRPSVPRMAIANLLPGGPEGIYFSEALGGPVDDTDLNLWLAIVGGGHIIRSRTNYMKIANVPLHDFAGELSGASPVYVIAGFEDPEVTLRVSVSDGSQALWQVADTAGGMDGIREAYVGTHPGVKLVSLRVGEQAAYTVASLASPNRAMLITVTLDDAGEFCIGQYLLPLGTLVDQLPKEVQDHLHHRNQLNDVRLLAQASRAFRMRRKVFKESVSEESPSREDLTSLVYAKWRDPIGAALAGYEMLRRGDSRDRPLMSVVVDNMLQFFPDLPDSHALAKFAGEESVQPHGTPLFFDGLRAFPDYREWLPLPATHLDFSSPWTAWRAAVS